MVYTALYDSPFGKIYMNSDGEYLTGLWFAGSKDNLKHIIGADKDDLPVFEDTHLWLDIYFAGGIPDFIPDIKLEEITPFRQEVIDVMMKIPYGKTITYGDIAKEIASRRGIEKMSARAVGAAVGSNPICIIIPCHRVIGSGGNLTGYGGGIQNKIALLKLEGNDMNNFVLPTRK